MSIKTLVERASEILIARGVMVRFEQIILRHEGMTLEVKSVMSDYQIDPEDIVEILVSRSIRSPDKIPQQKSEAGLLLSHESSSNLEPKDIFLPPRDIFGAAAKRDLFTVEVNHEEPLVQRVPSTGFLPTHDASARRDIFLPRDIFGASETRELSTVAVGPGRRSSPKPEEIQSKFYDIRKGHQIGVCDS